MLAVLLGRGGRAEREGAGGAAREGALEDLTSGAGTQGDARGDVRALLDDVLDALRPGRSLAWRESAVGVGGPNAYVDVQKTAVSLVQKDFVSVLVDAESGTLQECFYLLVDEGRALDNFIEAAQRQGKAEAPPQQEAPRYAKEFKPFAFSALTIDLDAS